MDMLLIEALNRLALSRGHVPASTVLERNLPWWVVAS